MDTSKGKSQVHGIMRGLVSAVFPNIQYPMIVSSRDSQPVNRPQANSPAPPEIEYGAVCSVA